jgi:hypothetical protein
MNNAILKMSASNPKNNTEEQYGVFQKKCELQYFVHQ